MRCEDESCGGFLTAQEGTIKDLLEKLGVNTPTHTCIKCKWLHVEIDNEVLGAKNKAGEKLFWIDDEVVAK